MNKQELASLRASIQRAQQQRIAELGRAEFQRRVVSRVKGGGFTVSAAIGAVTALGK